MATPVSFHAHPDDETVLCGGTGRRGSRPGLLSILELGVVLRWGY